MAQYVNSTFGPPNVVPVNIIIRKSANYHPSIWGDKFLVLDNSAIVKTDANCKEEERLQLLKNNVKKMLCAARGTPQQDDQLMISLIDDIQRLGLSYHFETEIDTILQHIQDSFCEHDYGSKHGNGDYNLHDVALCFRLLRQQGHNVSSDVFYNFKDSNGKFKENLVKDVRGMLSLFEATHLRVHGEDILEDALEFTTSHLNQYLKSINQVNPLACLVDRALKYPLRRGLNRLVARHYISIYHQFHWHNQVLLELAKCDFNLVQKLHQMELCHVTRWWKNLDVAINFPFARDRLVECYFWTTGVYFEPRYARGRIFLTKIISITSIVDDIYDVHGTVEEVQQFTDAIEKWDISAIDQLPEYMTRMYQTLMDVFSEAEEDMAKAGIPSHGIGYAKDAYKRLTREFLQEAKWSQSSYFPTYEEYMSVALVTGAYEMLSISSLVNMSNVASREAFDCISKDPLIVRAASVICRLSDDIVGHEFEMQRPHIPTAVECFMKEHGVPKEIAYVELKKVIVNAWKDMNQECLNPIPAPMQLLARVFNLACVIDLLYDGDDGYTHSSTTTKDMIIDIFIDPIPE